MSLETLEVARQEKNAILRALSEKNRELLFKIRIRSWALYTERQKTDPEAEVSANDAREIFDKMYPPGTERPNRNVLGAVFKGDYPVKWQFIGIEESEAETRHASIVCRWRPTTPWSPDGIK